MSLTNYDLIEARRRLSITSSRSPSITSTTDGRGTKSPKLNWKNLDGNRDRPENKICKFSGTSSPSGGSSDKLWKWVNINGNWRKIMLEAKDDFKDENLAEHEDGISGEQSDQYWNELNDDRQRKEQYINRMLTEFIDVPEILIASADVYTQHQEEVTNCEVTQIIRPETVNAKFIHIYFNLPLWKY